jgi:hypothetical protein
METGEVEIAPKALAFPGEASAIPDIRPAIAATGLAGPLLEGVGVADRVCLDRVMNPDQGVGVVEMELGGGALLKMGGADRFPMEGERCKRSLIQESASKSRHGMELS